MSYYKGRPRIKLENPLNIWLRKVKWQIKYVASPLPEYL